MPTQVPELEIRLPLLYRYRAEMLASVRSFRSRYYRYYR
jgi:hypothetical protein